MNRTGQANLDGRASFSVIEGVTSGGPRACDVLLLFVEKARIVSEYYLLLN